MKINFVFSFVCLIGQMCLISHILVIFVSGHRSITAVCPTKMDVITHVLLV